MDEFIRHYGLIALYAGMWIEGETVLVIAGFLLHQGLFGFWSLFVVAVLGTLSVDHAMYFAGRFSGRLRVVRHIHPESVDPQSWKARLGENWLAFVAIRFIYGTRLPFIFYLGTRQLAWRRFFERECLAAAAWCFVWLLFGHFIGRMLEAFYGELHRHHRVWTVVVLAAAGTAITVCVRFWQYHRRRAQIGPPVAAA
ncbi:MAG: VTT domain-containing protein [Acidobacteriota bacterium]